MKQVNIPRGSARKLVHLRTELFNQDMERLARSLVEGRITLRFWEEEMRTQLRLFHTGMTAIGKGGWHKCRPADWGRTGAILKEQYGWLHGFAQDIADRRETITERMIAWRAKLYGAKGGYTASIALAGDIADLLPWMPKDGSTICLNGCKCYWSMTESAPENGEKLVTAVWVLTKAEHCDTCVERDGRTIQFLVPENMDVPARIGGI